MTYKEVTALHLRAIESMPVLNVCVFPAHRTGPEKWMGAMDGNAENDSIVSIVCLLFMMCSFALSMSMGN